MKHERRACTDNLHAQHVGEEDSVIAARVPGGEAAFQVGQGAVDEGGAGRPGVGGATSRLPAVCDAAGTLRPNGAG